MNVVVLLAALATAIMLHTDRVDSTASGIQCPVVGPEPPASCDGRDGVWLPVSVEGSNTFCALGPEVCVADVFASCPGPTVGLPFGSKCAQLKTNVYGCVPKTSCTDGDFGAAASPSDVTCERGCSIDSSIPKHCDGSNGWTPVSVVNASTFCTAGAVCVADTPNACPGPQRGLPFGSSCVKIPSGVFGCVSNHQCQRACAAATVVWTPAPPPPPSFTTVSTPATPVPSTTAPVTMAPVPSLMMPLPQTTVPPSSTVQPASAAYNAADDLTATVAPDPVDSNTDLLPIPDPNAAMTLDMLPNFESRHLLESTAANGSPPKASFALVAAVAAVVAIA